MAVNAVVDGRVSLPFSLFTKESAAALKRRLTFTVKAYHPTGKDRTIETFSINKEEQRVTVPFSYGLQLLQELTDEDEADVEIAEGIDIGRPPKMPDPTHPSAPPNQAQFFDDLEEAMRTRRTVLAVAPTGSGKTVSLLNAIGKIGKAALIIVPSKELALQWKREAEKHLGLRPEEIGSLEEGKCVYHGSKITVAVIHNVYQRRLSQRFKDTFGIVAWDEAHRLGAEMFSETFGKFSAKVRVGLTATPYRKDGLMQVVTDCFGHVCVEAEYEALPCKVMVVEHHTHLPEWRYVSKPVLISKLTKNQSRNRMLVRIVKTLFQKDRNILVLSDRVAHLQTLMDMCEAEGIPRDKMGQYTRKFIRSNGKEGTFKREELKKVRDEATIVFSTYAMGKEAIDIPRLDAGIDVTPRADGIQAIGRIRRPYPNKKMPVWFTIRDTGIPPLLRTMSSRLRDYAKSATVEVKDYGTA